MKGEKRTKSSKHDERKKAGKIHTNERVITQ